ncbi:hypothetical protein GCM10027610_069310 [Dactylosporangium cerinum]
MEAGGDLAQRPVRLRREQDDQQRGAQVEPAGGDPEPGLDRDQPDRQRPDQVQGGRGEERDPQHPHGRGAVPVGHPPDLRDLAAGPAEQAQRRDAAHGVKEVPGEAGAGLPAVLGAALGGPADERAEQRHERQGDQDDPGRGGVGEQHRDHDEGRQDHAEDE